MLYFTLWPKKRTAVKISFCGSLPSPWLRWHSSGTTSRDKFSGKVFRRTGEAAGAWAVLRLRRLYPYPSFGPFAAAFVLTTRSQQEFGGDQVFQGATYALEYGDFLRAASSLLFSAD
jgi:hypothetical protein